MAKGIVTRIVRIFLFAVGIAAVCVGHNRANQVLVYGGVTLMTIAFLLSCVSGKKDKG